MKYDWFKYKEGLHLLLLSKDKEQELIDILECDLNTAMSLTEEELLERRRILQILMDKYGKRLSEECYELFFVIGNMESNYRFVIKQRGIVNTNEYSVDEIPTLDKEESNENN